MRTTYVILQPNSITNPSEEYRVVDVVKWNSYRQGDASAYPVAASAATYPEAEATRDRMNAA